MPTQKAQTNSMTAFARCADNGEWGTAVWEIRSVNHRYLDASWRLPSDLRELETPLRETLQQHVDRGKVECSLRFTSGPAVESQFKVNEPLLNALLAAQEKVASHINNHSPMQAMEVLVWPNMLSLEAKNLSLAKQAVSDLFLKTLEKLNEARGSEGDVLANLLLDRIKAIQTNLVTIKKRKPIVIQQMRDNLLARFEDAKVTLEPERLEQEMVMAATKLDIAEECDRLTAHLDAVDEVLQKGGTIGRRLDFFMQELNREANTIASKSNDAELTQCVVDCKVLIEQMREQVQNIA